MSSVDLKGRTLPDSDPNEVSEVPAVHVARLCVPVQGSVLWTHTGLPGVHQGVQGSHSLSSLRRDEASVVSQRLADPGSLPRVDGSVSRSGTISVSSSQHQSQC